MLHNRDNSGSKVWRKWHEMRAKIRETVMSPDDELDPIEREKWDISNEDVNRDDNPRTFTTTPMYEGDKKRDVRDDPRY